MQPPTEMGFQEELTFGDTHDRHQSVVLV